jgi:polysaccharide export outer membrane protein
MRSFGSGVILALCLGIATSGAALGDTAPSQGPADYQLAVQDRVKVTVYNEPTLSGEFMVNADGALAYPLIGAIPAEHLTAKDLERTLAAKLADGFLRNPKVAVEVISFQPIYVYGEVNGPGQYSYQAGMNVISAVALAHGFTYRANKRGIYLKHASQSVASSVRVSPDTPVAPGDTIRVSERFF